FSQLSRSSAECCGRHNLVFTDRENSGKYIHKILIVNEEDRKTEEEYASTHNISVEEVRNRFGATGQIRCPHGLASAKVTIKNNIITTGAHVFMNQITCETDDDPTKCLFQLAEHRQDRLGARRRSICTPLSATRRWPSFQHHHRDRRRAHSCASEPVGASNARRCWCRARCGHRRGSG